MIRSGPIMPMILAREDAVSHWRNVMGPTKTAKYAVKLPYFISNLPYLRFANRKVKNPMCKLFVVAAV